MSDETKQAVATPPSMLKPNMLTMSIAYAYWEGRRIGAGLPWPPPIIMLDQRPLNQRRK